MEQYAHFNTAFVVLDDADIDAFIDVAFRSLKREAKKTINATGTFSITMTVEALKTDEAKAQVLALEEAA